MEYKAYDASAAQKRLYLIDRLYGDSILYNMPFCWVIEGGMEPQRLESALEKLVQRHEPLRTCFVSKGEELLQKVYEKLDIRLKYREIQEPLTIDIDAVMERFDQPFDLAHAPLWRMELLRLEPGKHLLLFDIHHIIFDGVSQDVMVNDLATFYTGGELPGLEYQYVDYTLWQNEQWQGDRIKRQEQYWLKEFEGELPVVEIPVDYPRGSTLDIGGDIIEFEMDREMTSVLQQLALKGNTTRYVILLALYTILLSRTSGQEDIVVGTPVTGRTHREFEPLIGMFVNTLAMRNRPHGHKTFTAFLQEVTRQVCAAFENQDYPFEMLVEKLSPQRHLNRNPIFDHLLALQNYSQGMEIPALGQHKLKWTSYRIKEKVAKFDMALFVFERQGQMLFELQYHTALFRRDTMERFSRRFILLMQGALYNPGREISQLEIMTKEEVEYLLYTLNDTQTAYPGDKTIHELVERQVEKNPDHIALVGPKLQNTNYQAPVKKIGALGADVDAFGGEAAFGDDGHPSVGPVRPVRPIQLTYRELNEQSNRLAGLLIEKGTRPDTIVGIMIERSLEMIAGILAILKAGGAYLPIDPDYPQERIDYMLKDSSAKILLTANEIVSLSTECIVTPEAFPNPTEGLNFTNDQCPMTNDRLAYVIYTSGSTGNPKGVMLEHRGLVNLLLWGIKFTNLDFRSVLQFTTITFDISFQEIFSTLLSSGKLVSIPGELRTDIPGLFNLIERNEIKTVFLPIAFLKIIFNDPGYAGSFPACVRHIQTAGDLVMISEGFAGYLRRNKVYLHNHYGPAEAHVVTAYTVNPAGEIPRFPPIGKPIANTFIYMMDKYLDLQPVGLVGELYIGGIQVGRGYLNNPGLTADKFVISHWSLVIKKLKRAVDSHWSLVIRKPKRAVIGHSSLVINIPKLSTNDRCPMTNDRFHSTTHRSPLTIYRTGDLARWKEDGNIEFLGRLDYQVKIRGFRVEMGEIERRLLNYPGIKEAVVLAKADNTGDKYLCAYIVSEMELHLEELREFLSGKLPDYMIPTYFMPLKKIPLTPNGKIDRQALPEPELKVGDSYTAPGNEIEKKLVESWSEILGRDALHKAKLKTSIGIDDNFFQLGGHSLKAIQLVSILQKDFEVSLTDIFRHQTISSLAAVLPYKKSTLQQKIEELKRRLSQSIDEQKLISTREKFESQERAYREKMEKYRNIDLSKRVTYRSILITGASGYLGIHLLKELLNGGNAHLYLLVRGKSHEEAEQKLLRKIKFYFNEELYEIYRPRIHIVSGDMASDRFGLSEKEYNRLSEEIDCIVNSAALVKHYGFYNDFLQVNVEGVRRLIEFAFTGKKKDLNHISTVGAGAGKIKGNKFVLFTEFDHNFDHDIDNYYIQTKIKGEKLIDEARERGLKASIFRVGNLVFHSGTGRFQENIEDNAFYSLLKSFIKIGIMIDSDEPAPDFSFVDHTGKAVALLYDREALLGETHHLLNPNTVSLIDLAGMLGELGKCLRTVTLDEFLDILQSNYENPGLRKYIEDIILHANLLSKSDDAFIKTVSEKTCLILNRLDFYWPKLNKKHVERMVSYCKEIGFI